MSKQTTPGIDSKTPCPFVLRVYNTVWHSGLAPDAVVANVAQLVEQRFRKARVAGSSPVVGSILFQPFFYDRWTQIIFRLDDANFNELRNPIHHT